MTALVRVALGPHVLLDSHRYVFWYRGLELLTYNSDRGVSVHTSRSDDGTTINSTLVQREVTPEQSGNYTCQPSNARQASIQVFVSEGECMYSSHQLFLAFSKRHLSHLDRLSEPLLRPDVQQQRGGGGAISVSGGVGGGGSDDTTGGGVDSGGDNGEGSENQAEADRTTEATSTGLRRSFSNFLLVSALLLQTFGLNPPACCRPIILRL